MLLSPKHPKWFKLYGPLPPSNRSSTLSFDEFISFLKSLSVSFIKLSPLLLHDLLSSITDDLTSISFIDYQLRYFNSLIKANFKDLDNQWEDTQTKIRIYEEIVNEVLTTLLQKTNTEEWRCKVSKDIFSIYKLVSDIFKDHKHFIIFKKL